MRQSFAAPTPALSRPAPPRFLVPSLDDTTTDPLASVHSELRALQKRWDATEEPVRVATLGRLMLGAWPAPIDVEEDTPLPRLLTAIAGTPLLETLRLAAVRAFVGKLPSQVAGRYQPTKGTLPTWLEMHAEDALLETLTAAYQADASLRDAVFEVVYRRFFLRAEGRVAAPIVEGWIVRTMGASAAGMRLQAATTPSDTAAEFFHAKLLDNDILRQYDADRGSSFRQWLRQCVVNYTRDQLARTPGPDMIALEALGDAAAQSQPALTARTPASVEDRDDSLAMGSDAPSRSWERLLARIIGEPTQQVLWKLLFDLPLRTADLELLAGERLIRWAAELLFESVVTAPPPLPEAPEVDDPTSRPTAQDDPEHRLRSPELTALRERLRMQLGAQGLPREAFVTFDDGADLETSWTEYSRLRQACVHPIVQCFAVAGLSVRPLKAGVCAELPEALAARMSVPTQRQEALAALEAIRQWLTAETQYRTFIGPIADAIHAQYDLFLQATRQRRRDHQAQMESRWRRLERERRMLETAWRQQSAAPSADAATLDRLAEALADRERRVAEYWQESRRGFGLKEAELAFMLGRTPGAIAGMKFRLRRLLDLAVQAEAMQQAREKVTVGLDAAGLSAVGAAETHLGELAAIACRSQRTGEVDAAVSAQSIFPAVSLRAWLALAFSATGASEKEEDAALAALIPRDRLRQAGVSLHAWRKFEQTALHYFLTRGLLALLRED